MGVFEDQGLAHAQRLAVHLVDLLTFIVLDPEIVADGDHLLAHLVVVAAAARSPELAVFLAFFSSASHNIPLLYPIQSWQVLENLPAP